MVKSGTDRSAKYSAKFDPEVIRSRYTATSESAKAKQVTAQETAAQVNLAVRNILDTAGVAPIMTMPYQAFGNKLIGITNKFAGATAIGVATKAIAEWADYGLDQTVLQQIWDIFNDVLGSAPSPVP